MSNKRCKHCQGTDFGVVVKKIQKAPFRMTDGKPVGGPLAAPEESTEVEVNFCFGCNKPITDEDLTEEVTCEVCGKKVKETVNGKCPECEAQAKAYSRMNKDELIMMLMKGQSPQIVAAESKEGKQIAEEKKQLAEGNKAKEETPSEKQIVEEPKVEAEPDKEPIAEKESPKVVSTEVKLTEEEKSENLTVANKKEEDLNDELFVNPEINDINPTESNFGSEVDILSQIDNIDVASLNIMNEEVTEAI